MFRAKEQNTLANLRLNKLKGQYCPNKKADIFGWNWKWEKGSDLEGA